MAWFPHYEEILINPMDLRPHFALAAGRARWAVDTDNALGSFLDERDWFLGSIDAPQFHIRPAASRQPTMAAVEANDYKGILERAGVRLHA